MLEVPAGRAALAQAHRDDATFLMTVLLSAASQRLSLNYGILVLKLCDKLFQAGQSGAGRWEQGTLAVTVACVNVLLHSEFPAHERT